MMSKLFSSICSSSHFNLQDINVTVDPILVNTCHHRIVHFSYVGKSKWHLIMLLSWIFQITHEVKHFLYVNIGHLNFLFCEMPIQSLCHFLLEFLLLCSKYLRVILISWQILYQLIHLQCPFPFHFSSLNEVIHV